MAGDEQDQHESKPPEAKPPDSTIYQHSSISVMGPDRRCGRRLLRLIVALSVVAVVGAIIGLTLSFLSEKSSKHQTEGDSVWGDWGAWGPCSDSCSGSRRLRERQCPAGTCPGTDKQAELCVTQQCPREALPVWSSWEAWSSCSVTCGSGSQSRQRTCPDKQCVGDPAQHRDCPGWPCPDCDAACPGGGVMNSECSWCTCSGGLLTGRVLTTYNTPLAQVSLAPANAPYHIVATTDAHGLFSVSDVCIGEDLLFTKTGFVEQIFSVLTLDTPVQISMAKIEPLSLVREPESKMRITGETAVFCCHATGSPPPTYYEWFKDGSVVVMDVTSGESSLVLENVDVSSSGDYRCRASNDVSAIYSHAVQLKVEEDSSGFCSAYPQSHRVGLDPGCKSPDGAQAIDVGKCETRKCRQPQENQTAECQDEETFCCGPTSFSRVDLVCEDTSDFIYVVKSCGCTPCDPGTFTVRGQLMAADTAEPVAYGKVQLQGGEPTWADDGGQFTFTVPQSQQRVVIAATDDFGEMVPMTKVVSVDPETGTVNVIINMLRKAPGVSLNASEENVIGMGEEHGEMFAGLHIPAQSVYAADGSLYTGEVRVSVNVIDPRNMTDVYNAPGDLSFVNQEGEEQELETFGMFNLQLEDPLGNPLQAQGDLQLFLDASLVSSDPETLQNSDLPAIWALDPNTGRWVQIGEMTVQQGSSRFKRQTGTILVGNINVSYSGVWYNYDLLRLSEECVANIKVFKTNAFINIEDDYRRPYALMKSGLRYQVYSEVRQSQDHYCLTLPCDINNNMGYAGHIMVDVRPKTYRYWHGLKFEEFAFPVSDSNKADQGIKDEAMKTRLSYSTVHNAFAIDFSYKKQQSRNGPFYPFYRWGGRTFKDWSLCRDAKTDDHHFKFYIEEVTTKCKYDEDTKTKEHLPITTARNLLAWYNKDRFSNVPVAAYTVVYVKVTTNSSKPVLLRADSLVGNTSYINPKDQNDRISPGDLYGYRQDCKTDQPALCLEVKPSGYVSERHGKGPGIKTDETVVAVYTHVDYGRKFCTGYKINEKLNAFVGHPNPGYVNSHRFEMRLNEAFAMQHSHETGIYWHIGDSKHDLEDVKKHAYKACMAGSNPASSTIGNGENDVNSALEFFCD